MVADREAGPPTLTTRVQRIVERLRRLGPIAAALGVLARYDRAGGGLLAAGLAYSAMFALLPALLLIVGVAGLVIDDPARRAELVDALARQVPPLEEFFTVALGEMTKGAAPFSTLALIGLVWGASRFYGALDDAFSRVFVAAAPRSLLDRTVRGLA
ncbi:MAG TPA: YhjD/YihY/BrkB family envelope integrity protein, partial [Candidatus Limnocylindrales bacterium]